MKIMGIDPSLTSFAAVVYDTTDEKVVHAANVRSKLRSNQRIDEILMAVTSEVFSYNVQLTFIEGYSFGSRGQGLYGLAELGGVLRFAFYKRGFPYRVIPPTSWKKFVTGTGIADKTVVQNHIRRKGIEFPTEDLYDAFGVAITGTAWINADNGVEQKLTQYQEEAIKNLRFPVKKSRKKTKNDEI